MTVLVDADSLVWSSTYRFKEAPDDDGWNSLEEGKSKFDEVLMKIINDLEAMFDVDKVIIFNGAKGNFRKEVSKDYKANRKNRELPPILDELHQYVRDQYNSISGINEETDDVVAKYWKSITDVFGKEEAIIVSIDKDYKQLPCLLYNYGRNHQIVYDISDHEALYNFYTQMIVGDSADNVNYCKGYGPKYAEKQLEFCQSKFSFIRKVYELYLKIYNENAKEKYKECYTLLKLRTE
jgi:5'-3' exonuclease